MAEQKLLKPDNTAERAALWRALHLQADAAPYVFEDSVGLQLLAPEYDWQSRPDMSEFTRPFRASILARARYVEDLLVAQMTEGLTQYVLLGAGLDTFAQRRPNLAEQVKVYEIDQPETQQWKQQRLQELGFSNAQTPTFVPVDFEAEQIWWKQLQLAGFSVDKKALVSSMGVSMYLTHEAIAQTLQNMTKLAKGSNFVMSFMVPIAQTDERIRFGVERAAAGAAESGNPFISFFTPEDMVAFASEFGFAKVEHIASSYLAERYFSGRQDGLYLPISGEEILLVTV